MRRFALKALIGVVTLVAIAALGAYVFVRRSLPLLDGTSRVSGISSTVDIIRDTDAIPHIYASNKLDVLFGLGYAHAQDRLWQMEFQRRIGHGRLSEIFGAATIRQDRFLRTVGFGRAAHAAWTTMPDWGKQQIDAYVAGVNAFISAHHGADLPPEFTLLRFAPEPWIGADVLVWVKMMAWDLSKNYSLELLRHDIIEALGPRKLADLTPPYPKNGLSILGAGYMGLQSNATPGQVRVPRETTRTSVPSRWFSALAASLEGGNAAVRDVLLGGATTEAFGSNSWVVDGTLTATGKPLLANDPHLGAQLPSLWYLAHIATDTFDAIGATLPGAPAIAIGRNRFVAWGETNLAADVEDLYRERLDATGRFVEFAGEQEPLTIVPETIRVKGAAPVRVDVRITRHGPLISDAINANNAELGREPRPQVLEPLALRWTALDPVDTTVLSFLRMPEARNWSDFTAALREFVVPAQNFVYADVDGHIGYYAPGRIPVRAHGDGTLPAEGWSGQAEWTGWVPFDQLPHALDPSTHLIVTANNRPASPPYSHFLGVEWTEPYRAQRIVDLLQRKPKLTPEDFATIQADTFSLHAQSLLPTLLRQVRPLDAADEQAMGLLRGWNYDARGDSAAAAIFQAWFFHLTHTIVEDDLGPTRTADYMGQDRSSFVARFLANTLATGESPWCDDVRTPQHETCADAVTTALHTAVLDLTRQLGADMTRWRWDAAHHAIFPHQGLDSIAALRPLLSRSVPHGGDWSTVNVGPVVANHPYDQHSIPGYRQIIDLSALDDSRFINAGGQSGHPLSGHYDDFLADWQAVNYRRMRIERADVERNARAHLKLVPRGTSK